MRMQRNKCGGNKVRFRGSATIEMSILMPMLVVILLLLIYMSFYLYDRTMMYCNAYVAALYGVEDPDESNEESYEKVKARIEELLQGQTIAMTETGMDIQVDYQGIRIDFCGNVDVPIAGETIFWGEWNRFDVCGAVSVQRHKPVTFIRQCRKIEQLIE